MNKLILSLFVFVISMPSYAYVGPGMGGGFIAAVLGFLLAILLAIWGVLYYPVKRALKERKEKKISAKELENDP